MQINWQLWYNEWTKIIFNSQDIHVQSWQHSSEPFFLNSNSNKNINYRRNRTMMDTYQVEFFAKDGTRVGIQVAAYSSYDAQKYAEKMPNYSCLASFPEKININH